MSEKNLRNLYRDDYVRAYHVEPGMRLQRLLPFMGLDKNHIVADFGCGNGLLLEVIHDRVNYYHGVDFSEEFIEEARKRKARLSISNAAFYCESIVEFCSRHARYFDCAFALDFSEHVHDEGFLEIAIAIRGALVPNGKFFLHTPNAEFFVEIMKEKGWMRQFPEHIAIRNAAQIKSLLEQASFRKIKVHFLPHYLPQLSCLHKFQHLPYIGRYFRARMFVECINQVES